MLESVMSLPWKRSLIFLAVVGTCECLVVPNHSRRLHDRLAGSSVACKVKVTSSLTRQLRVLAQSTFADDPENSEKPSASVATINNVAALNAVRYIIYKK